MNSDRRTKTILNLLKLMLAGAVLLLSVTFRPVTAQAVETVNVNGTVATGTEGALLVLQTAEGLMQIRIDFSTDLSKCAGLFPNEQLTVSVYGGNDGYMHAAAIITDRLFGSGAGSAAGAAPSQTAAGSGELVVVDDAVPTVILGFIEAESTPNLLKIKLMEGGTMLLKVDSVTYTAAFNGIQAGAPVAAMVGHGSDAYMHALTLSGGAGTGFVYPAGTGDNVVWASAAAAQPSRSSSSSSSSESSSGSSSSKETIKVTGTIKDGSKSTLLILDSADGEWKIKMDSDTDQSKAKLMFVGGKVEADIYYGGDEYWRAASVKGTYKLEKDVAVSSDGSLTLTGTIGDDSNENMLNFVMSDGGVMKVKIDTTTNVSKVRVVKPGQKVTISVVRGSDEYMHAISIS